MSLFGFARGTVDGGTASKLLTTTAATVILTPTSKGSIVFRLRALNIGAGTPTLTLDRYNGTTAFPYVIYSFTATPTAGAMFTDDFEFVLPNGWTLRATASVANVIYVHPSYVTNQQ